MTVSDFFFFFFDEFELNLKCNESNDPMVYIFIIHLRCPLMLVSCLNNEFQPIVN